MIEFKKNGEISFDTFTIVGIVFMILAWFSGSIPLSIFGLAFYLTTTKEVKK